MSLTLEAINYLRVQLKAIMFSVSVLDGELKNLEQGGKVDAIKGSSSRHIDLHILPANTRTDESKLS